MTISPRLRAAAGALAAVTLLSACTSAGDPAPGPDATASPDAPAAADPDEPTDPVRTPDAPQTETEATEDAAGPLEARDGTALVFIDGWSLRAAGSRSLQLDVDGRSTTADWKPVSGAQLVALAGSHPEIVEAAISRMVDAASTVECDADGCLIGDRPVEEAAGGDVACVDDVCTDTWYRLRGDDLAAIARASEVAGYGDVYDSWGIGHLLYVTTADIVDARTVTLTHEDASLSLPLSAELAADSEDDGDLSTDPLQTGFAEDVHLVAFGLGRLFTPNAVWREYPDAPYIVDDLVTTPAEPESLDALGGLPLMGGVGSLRPASAGLNPSQLTYFTSPTTGCGVGLHCTPTVKVQGSVSVAAMERFQVCGAGGGEPTFAIVTDATVTMDTDAVVHQHGIWNGRQPADFTGHTGGLFSGQAELVGDGTRMRIIAIQILRSPGVVHDMTGYAWQLGVDDPAEAEAPFDGAKALNSTGLWRTC